MPATEDALWQLAGAAARASDPGEALRLLVELRREVDAFERRQVARALDDGWSFGAVARLLGISRQAAHRRYRDLGSGQRAAAAELERALAPLAARSQEPAAREARYALRLARQLAAAQDMPVESEYILWAVLRGRDSPLLARLRRLGVTEEGVAQALRTGTPDPALERSLRAAIEAGTPLRPEHLLRAALRDPQGGASRTLEALGVPPEAVRSALASR